MTTSRLRGLLLAGALATALLPSTGAAAITCSAGSDQWLGVNPGTGSWADAQNWSAGVPTASSDVCIPAGTPKAPVITNATAALASTVSADTSTNVTVSVGATLTVSGASGFGTLTVKGAVSLGGPSGIASLQQSGGDLGGTGTITIRSGRATGGTWSGSGPLIVPGGATLTVGGGVGGTSKPLNNSGVLTLAPYTNLSVSTLLNAGLLQTQGSATVNGNLTNTGVLRIAGAGATAGLQVGGSVTQGASARLEVDVVSTGLGNGIDTDFLGVEGSAQLGGTLAITTSPDINQSAAHDYVILTTGGAVSGQFATVTGAVGFPGGVYTPQYNGQDVRLSFAPPTLTVSTDTPGIDVGALAPGASTTKNLGVHVASTYRSGYTVAVQQSAALNALLPLSVRLTGAPAGATLWNGAITPATPFTFPLTTSAQPFGQRAGTSIDENGLTASGGDAWNLALRAGPVGWARVGTPLQSTVTFTVVSP